MSKHKLWLSIALAISLLTILALATALPLLELRPGEHFTAQTMAELMALVAQFSIYRDPLLILFAALLILVFIWAQFSKRRVPVMPPPPRKKRSIWATLLQVLMWTVAILIIRRQLQQGQFNLVPPQAADAPDITAPVLPGVPVTHIPEWFAFLASFILVVLLGGILWRAWHRRRRPPRDTLELLVQEARSARKALQSGQNFRNVILRCYYEMSQTLVRQRGIRRQESMTAREFQRSLIELGLPEEPVDQLTSLFEAVRYGAKELGKQAERQAIDCLEAIVQVSGRA